MPTPAQRRTVPLVTGAIGAEAATLMPVVRAAIASILHDRRDDPDVEDCAQEVLRRVIEGQSRLRPDEALRPWMLGIARHVAIDHIRIRQREKRRAYLGSHETEGDTANVMDRIADPSPTVDDQVERMQRDQRLRAAMERLTEGQRNAMMMFHLEGLGYQEVAERLGVPLGTVATWISRGRRAIAAELRIEMRKP